MEKRLRYQPGAQEDNSRSPRRGLFHQIPRRCPGQTRWGGSSPVATYQREAGKLASQIEKAGQKVDWSRVDFSVTAKMAKSGDFTADQIKKAIQVASPGVTSRHQGAVADYAARTLQKVIESVPGASQALSLALQATKRAMTLER